MYMRLRWWDYVLFPSAFMIPCDEIRLDFYLFVAGIYCFLNRRYSYAVGIYRCVYRTWYYTKSTIIICWENLPVNILLFWCTIHSIVVYTSRRWDYAPFICYMKFDTDRPPRISNRENITYANSLYENIIRIYNVMFDVIAIMWYYIVKI